MTTTPDRSTTTLASTPGSNPASGGAPASWLPRARLTRALMLSTALLVVAGCGWLTLPAAVAGPSSIEVEIMQNARMTLAEAIAFAEGEVGGRVIEAELDEDDDMYFYKLEVMRGDALVLVYMNPASGIMVGKREPGLSIGYVRSKDRDRATQVAGAGIPMVDALAIAARETGGFPIEIEIDRDDDHWIYEVKTTQPGLEHKLDIDMQTGAILDIDEDD